MAKRKKRKQKSSRSQAPPKRGASIIVGAIVIGLLLFGGVYFVFSTESIYVIVLSNILTRIHQQALPHRTSLQADCFGKKEVPCNNFV